MLLQGVTIGLGITGSFCTIGSIISEMERMVKEGACVYPVLSYMVDRFDTRFGTAEELKRNIASITANKIISTIEDAEPIGPKGLFDIFVVAPCTGNTMAKITGAITDTPVTMACKAHLRNGKPLLISLATNDGLGANAKNVGMLLNTKNIYVVPFGQDNPQSKPNSIISKIEMLIPAIIEALNGRQIQPLLV